MIEHVDDAAEHAPEYFHEFKHKGIVYVYDFDVLDIEQITLAQAIFNLHHERLEAPPKSYNDLMLSGDPEYLARAFGFLLLRKIDGELEEFSKTSDKAREFVKKLPSSHHQDLMRCKRDFFDKAGLLDIESTKRVKPLVALFSGVQSGLTQAPVTAATPSSQTISDGNGSMTDESFSDG